MPFPRGRGDSRRGSRRTRAGAAAHGELVVTLGGTGRTTFAWNLNKSATVNFPASWETLPPDLADLPAELLGDLAELASPPQPPIERLIHQEITTSSQLLLDTKSVGVLSLEWLGADATDDLLASGELERVLKPGAVVRFSGTTAEVLLALEPLTDKLSAEVIAWRTEPRALPWEPLEEVTVLLQVPPLTQSASPAEGFDAHVEPAQLLTDAWDLAAHCFGADIEDVRVDPIPFEVSRADRVQLGDAGAFVGGVLLQVAVAFRQAKQLCVGYPQIAYGDEVVGGCGYYECNWRDRIEGVAKVGALTFSPRRFLARTGHRWAGSFRDAGAAPQRSGHGVERGTRMAGRAECIRRVAGVDGPLRSTHRRVGRGVVRRVATVARARRATWTDPAVRRRSAIPVLGGVAARCCSPAAASCTRAPFDPAMSSARGAPAVSVCRWRCGCSFS